MELSMHIQGRIQDLSEGEQKHPDLGTKFF